MNKRLIAAVLAMIVLAGFITGCETAQGLYIAKDGVYYRNTDGKNHVGFLETEDGVMYFQKDGKKLDEGLVYEDGETYCIRNGHRVTGWQDLSVLGQGTYYFDESGRAVRGEHTIDGRPYTFDEETGELVCGFEITPQNSEQPSAEPSLTPSDIPSVSPSPEPPQETPASPIETAAVGPLTGNDKLDKAVKEIIDSLCSSSRTAEENLAAVFDWMVKELKYKFITVDLSGGYTVDLVNDLAEYIILNRRGSCEHEAALMAVFASRLGYESQVVAGEFLSDDKTEWVEHAWVISEVEGSYYHFDPLFGRNHTGGKPRTFFMKKDIDIEALHRWDRAAYPVCE